MRYIYAFLLVATATPLLGGCATIIHGSKQDISVSSTPSNARVLVDDMEMGTTPTVLTLSRKHQHTIRIELDGYQPHEVMLSRSVDGWIAGNIIFGGFIGLGVDAITGAMYKLSPDEIGAQLGTETGAVLGRDGVFIAVVLEPDPSWEVVGQLVRD